MAVHTITLPDDAIAAFCKRWQMTRLELFGSILRDDFGPESDIDFLVTFEEGAPWSLLDMVSMQEELAGITGRRVDLLSRKAIERSDNWIRREHILGTAETIYGA